MALMKVAGLIFSISKNGSRTGYFSEPASTECSRMWVTPVLFGGGVGKLMEKRFSVSSEYKCSSFAPVLRCSSCYATICCCFRSVMAFTSKPSSFCPTSKVLSINRGIENVLLFCSLLFSLGYFCCRE